MNLTRSKSMSVVIVNEQERDVAAVFREVYIAYDHTRSRSERFG